MKATDSSADNTVNGGYSGFSLVAGGPLFDLMRKSHLADDDLRLLRRRMVVISLIAWLPLLLLAALQGNLLGGNAIIPFLLDMEVHSKFLVAVPLLIAAEAVMHRRMRLQALQFLERHLVPERAMGRFEMAIASAYRLRNSRTAEVILVAFVYVVGILFVWRKYTALVATTWYATPSADGLHLSLAGI